MNVVASDLFGQSLIFLHLNVHIARQHDVGIGLPLGANKDATDFQAICSPFREKAIHIADLETEMIHYGVLHRQSRLLLLFCQGNEHIWQAHCSERPFLNHYTIEVLYPNLFVSIHVHYIKVYMAVGQAGWIRCGKLRLRGSGQGEKQ